LSVFSNNKIGLNFHIQLSLENYFATKAWG